MDESSEKSEQATPQKLRDAQAKGSSLRSAELPVLAMLCIAAAMLLVLVPAAARQTLLNTHQWVAAAHTFDAVPAPSAVAQLASPGVNFLVVLFTAMAVVAVVAAAAYGGIHFSAHPLKPDFSRINPAKGFKRIFSRHTLAETGKAICKTIAMLLVVWLVARAAIPELASSHAQCITHAGELLLHMTWLALGWVIAIQIFFTAFDLWYARRRFFSQLRMTRHELTDEYKRQEGDPETKRKRKQLFSSLIAQMRALGNVKDADVIITNPTHVAVALRYVPQRMNSPMVSAAGRGAVAAMIRTLARRYGVPVVRQPALARALIQEHPIGEEIAKTRQQQVVFVYRWLLSRPGTRLRFA